MEQMISPRVGIIVGYDSAVNRDAVGQYTERLHSHMQHVLQAEIPPKLDIELIRFLPRSVDEWVRGFASICKQFDLVHLQYPCEGWGTSVSPGMIPGFSRLVLATKHTLMVTFHEWRSMHPLRRASILPLAATADGLIFASPHERNGFLKSSSYRFRLHKPSTMVVPPGINLEVPFVGRDAMLDARRQLLNWNGVAADLLVGYFGFVYSSKQPDKMLAAIRHLHDQGTKARLVMAGDFLIDHQDLKEQFVSRVRSLGLSDYVVSLGYIEDQVRLAGVLSACNAVLLLFSDGVSARRSSFWYLLELGVPIVTTAPTFTDEFMGVLNFEALNRNKMVHFVDRAAHPNEVAGRLAEHSEYQLPQPQRGLSPNWTTAAEHHISFYKQVLAARH